MIEYEKTNVHPEERRAFHLNKQDIFDELLENYNQMTKQETQIADYILAHKMSIPYITISELAMACGVGTATVTRFAQKMDCESFKEFKFSALHSRYVQNTSASASGGDTYGYGDISKMDSVLEKSQKLCNIGIHALKNTLERLDMNQVMRAVEMLRKAETVFCYGQGSSSIIAMEAWGCFSTITKKFQWISNSHMQAATAALLGENDVILYFSYSGSARELVELKELPQRTKAILILVTRFPESAGAEVADVVLVCGASESPRQQGSVAIKIAQMLIIDILYNEYYAQEPISEENKNKSLASTIPLLLY